MMALQNSQQQHDLAANANHKTFAGYIIGFISSLLLTMLAFGIVRYNVFAAPAINYLVLAILALLQFLVQAVCFLRLNTSAAGRENLLTFLFTLLVVMIIISGSLWIMYNLNYNMIH